MINQLDDLKKKRDILNKRIRLVQNREEKQQRKNDIKRKILIGSYVLDKAKKENNFNEIKKQLDSFLTRDSDRKLFDLPIIPKE